MGIDVLLYYVFIQVAGAPLAVVGPDQDGVEPQVEL